MPCVVLCAKMMQEANRSFGVKLLMFKILALAYIESLWESYLLIMPQFPFL